MHIISRLYFTCGTPSGSVPSAKPASLQAWFTLINSDVVRVYVCWERTQQRWRTLWGRTSKKRSTKLEAKPVEVIVFWNLQKSTNLHQSVISQPRTMSPPTWKLPIRFRSTTVKIIQSKRCRSSAICYRALIYDRLRRIRHKCLSKTEAQIACKVLPLVMIIIEALNQSPRTNGSFPWQSSLSSFSALSIKTYRNTDNMYINSGRCFCKVWRPSRPDGKGFRQRLTVYVGMVFYSFAC